MYSKILFFCLGSLAVCQLSCRPDLKPPVPSSGDADFSSFVALGGNFMSGYADGALTEEGQKRSVPMLLSEQMGHAAGGTLFFLSPYMPDNAGLGINPKAWESDYQHSSILRYKTDCQGVEGLKPVKELFSAASAGAYLQHIAQSFQNISVPFAKIADYNNPSLGVSGNSNPYYARFSSNPGSSTMLGDAKAQQPTFFALWAGMEDVYDYARNGGYGQSVLSSGSFAAYLDTVCTQLNAKGVIANIPDLSSFPFYTLVPWNGLDLTQVRTDSLNLAYFGPPPYPGLDTFRVGKNGFMIEDPASTAPPAGYRKMKEGEYILLTIPLDSMKCNKMGSFIPLPDRYVLDSGEVSQINQVIADYNAVIMAKAQQYNLALVDMNVYFKSVVEGVKWNGVEFNATFVSGGFFSLDGYHPNQKGYALIANEFIRAVNSKYNASIPWVNCPDCNGIKFP